MSRVIDSKSVAVKELVSELKSFKTVCVASLENVPTKQLSIVRGMLSGLKILVKPKNVVKRALNEADKGLESLAGHLKGTCALLLSNDNPFSISIKLSKLKLPAYIKAGSVAVDNIVVEPGPTPFMPGPMMTELTNLGIKVNPKGGKLSITEPATLVKAGAVVPRNAASVLFKLGVKPINVGLGLVAAFEDGVVFSESELHVDVGLTMSNLLAAQSNAVNLAYDRGIVNSFTINLLLSKAFSQAGNLGREAGVITNDNVGEVMLTARAKALALAGEINWEVKA